MSAARPTPSEEASVAEGSSLTRGLAARVLSQGIHIAHGEPLTIDGVEFVPVAVVTYGFGGSDASDRWGIGGGGGGVVVPLGAYVRREDGVRFQPNTVVLLAMLPVAIVAGRLLLRLFRR